MSSTQVVSTYQYSYQERRSCLGCGSAHPLIEILDLGIPYLSDFVSPERASLMRAGRMKYRSLGITLTVAHAFPLKLAWCEQCSLAQLAHEAPLDWHFRQYWYKSGITQTMRDHLGGIVEEASSLVNLKAGDAVLDVGANDGTLLRMYPKEVTRCGFEPAENLREEAFEGGNFIVSEYFSRKQYFVPGPWDMSLTRFKVITAISMFYDVPDPLRFLQDVEFFLHENGVFILQMNYVKSMLEQNAFDNIGHEHLAYYSLTSLVRLIELAGMTVQKVKMNDLNGGSFRLYCRKQAGVQVEDSTVHETLMAEYRTGMQTLRPYQAFCRRVATIKDKVKGYLEQTKERLSDEVASGTTGEFLWRHVYVYGASTRGSTLLQYFDIQGLQYAVERDPRKVGLVTTGSWLRIVDEEQGRREASVFLVLPWAFKKEIIERERDFLAKGGQLVFPLPVPTVVTREGEREL